MANNVVSRNVNVLTARGFKIFACIVDHEVMHHILQHFVSDKVSTRYDYITHDLNSDSYKYPPNFILPFSLAFVQS